MAIFESTYRIGITDIGKANRVTNKAIIKILENVAGMHSEEAECGINDIKNTRLTWILLNWKIQIFKRALYNDEVIVKTWTRDNDKIIIYRDFEIYDMNNNLLTIATSKWVLVDIDTKKLALMPQKFLDMYKSETKSVFEKRTLDKLKEPESYESELKYKILRSNIDYNKHVHNLYYLDIAYEALPEEVYRADECNNIEIFYKKQIMLDDSIVCLYTKENEKNIVAVKSEDKNVLHAIIKLY